MDPYPLTMNKLYIDTRDNKKIIITVTKNGQEFTVESTPENSKADVVLKLIEKACQSAGITLQEIQSIYCEKGPGSFTGLRVGFAIANTLSLALLVPLNDNKIGTVDTPIYS